VEITLSPRDMSPVRCASAAKTGGAVFLLNKAKGIKKVRTVANHIPQQLRNRRLRGN